LKECLEEHKGRCKAEHGRIRTWTPSRLLDVGNVQADNDPKDISGDVRLCKGTDCIPRASYFTLSHCWGRVVPLRLLSNNIDDFQKRIKLNFLPKTFQDAVVITRTLGIQYLWIDSLCILQDFEDDLRRESSQMGEVYSNAMCNLAATGARDSAEGFLPRSEGEPRIWSSTVRK
ncbi:HET-domain-containing protein, partial [Saccharata proteae CBS 121410]